MFEPSIIPLERLLTPLVGALIPDFLMYVPPMFSIVGSGPVLAVTLAAIGLFGLSTTYST